MEKLDDLRRRRGARRFLSRSRYLRRVVRHRLERIAALGLEAGIRTWRDLDDRERARVRRRYRSRSICSCCACGNPRRHFRAMSVQEFRAQLDARQQLEEAGVRHRPGRFIHP